MDTLNATDLVHDHSGGGRRITLSSLRRMLPTAQRFLFGDDVFISYARADATNYALGLANELGRREISCFLDQWGTPPGDKLPEPLLQALRKSTMFVLVGTEKAAGSEAVRNEVQEFKRTGRPIIPISIGGALERAAWFPLIRGLSLARESAAAVQTATPSPEVVSRIVNAEGFTRRNKRLRTTFWSTVGVMSVLLATGGGVLAWQTREVASQTAQAREAARVASEANELANTAAEQKKTAESEAAAAKDLRDRAESEAKLAAKAAATARASAEEQRRTARALTLANASTSSLGESADALERSLLLALESLRQSWTSEGEAAWRRAMMLQMRPALTSYDLPAGYDHATRVVTVDPSGEWVALAVASTSRNRKDPNIRPGRLIVRSRQGAEVFAADLDRQINALALSPDGRWLAAGSDDEGSVWDVRSRAMVVQLWAKEADGALPTQRKILRTRNESRQGILTFSPNGQQLAVVTGDHVLRLFELQTQGWREGAPLVHESRSGSQEGRVLTAAFSPDGKWLATGFHAGIALWDLTTRARIAEEAIPGGDVFLLAFSSNGSWLASHNAGPLEVWKLERTGQGKRVSLKPHIERIDFAGNTGVDELAFSPMRNYLVVRNRDTVRLLAIHDVTSGINWIDSVTYGIPEAASWEKPPNTIWRKDTAQKWRELNRVSGRSFAFTSSELVVLGRRAVSVWEDGHSGWETHGLWHPRAVRSWSFSPDGRWLATAAEDGVLRVFDGRTLQSRPLPAASEDSVVQVHFSADGRWLAADGVKSLRVLNTGSWEPVSDPLPAVADTQSSDSRFTSDGHWVVSVSGGEIRILRTGTWKINRVVFQDQPDPTFNVKVDGVRVSPDGVWMATHEVFSARQSLRVADKNRAKAARWRIWNLTTATEVSESRSVLHAHESWPGYKPGTQPEEWSENSRWTASADGPVVRLRPRLPQDFIEAGCRRLSRNLSPEEWKTHFGDEAYRPTCEDQVEATASPHTTMPTRRGGHGGPRQR